MAVEKKGNEHIVTHLLTHASISNDLKSELFLFDKVNSGLHTPYYLLSVVRVCCCNYAIHVVVVVVGGISIL